jgi:hypothetical protein
MINENMIYENVYSKENLILPDVTVISPDKGIKSNLVVVESKNVLFPEAANSLDGAKSLKETLSDVQELSKDQNYSVSKSSLNEFREFGIQKGAEDIIELILKRYVDICREKREKGLGFSPGLQYNFLGLDSREVNVTISNYGLFGATLLKAAEDPDYKSMLIKEGEKLFGSKNRHGFIVNPPATNAICETKEGYILFVNRGPTAEYSKMYHNLAAGHHNPEKLSGKGKIPLEELIVHQIDQEVGLSKENLKEFNFNGIAFSAGYDKDIFGTEKVELLTYAKINKNIKEVIESMKNAPHKWETRQLLAVPKENIDYLVKKTSDSKKPVGYIPGLKKYFNDVQPGTDPNSKSYWVPVGLANLIKYTGTNPYIPE